MAMLTLDDNGDLPKLYDWLLILPQEVEYIWRAPWNWAKVLYLFTRYIPFASISMGIRGELFSHWLAPLPTHSRNPLSFNPVPALGSSLLTSFRPTRPKSHSTIVQDGRPRLHRWVFAVPLFCSSCFLPLCLIACLCLVHLPGLSSVGLACSESTWDE